ncbi:MAG: HlyC/CorC family transporter [Planctomycetes bacterium]|nr:HlyC/CorC family transporter [Planctomycetota bacterium]
MDSMAIVLECVLLGLSALISGSETALLSLDEEQARRVGPRAQALLARPQQLLSAVLIANVAVNTLFFAYSASAAEDAVGLDAWIEGLFALALVVVFGEVLPKNLARRSPEPIARIAAPLLTAIALFTSPLARMLELALIPMYRVLGRLGEREQGLSSGAISDALRQAAEQGHLLGDEARFLTAIVRLEDMRVREVMTPRVDLIVLDLSEEGRAEVVRRALDTKTPWVLVVDGRPDAIIGRVRTRNLAVQAARPVREMLEPCVFVPEVAFAVSALRLLREAHVAEGVVIDEWGGTAGLVSVETIFEEVVGDLRVEGEAAYQPVVEQPDGSFEVDGALSIRDWNERFGQAVVPREFETLSGFVTALLGRIPKVGDRCASGPLEFCVLRMKRRRIERVGVRALELGAREERA